MSTKYDGSKSLLADPIIPTLKGLTPERAKEVMRLVSIDKHNPDWFSLSVENGKYTWKVKDSGHIVGLRYGEYWSDGTGDKSLLCLLNEFFELKKEHYGCTYEKQDAKKSKFLELKVTCKIGGTKPTEVALKLLNTINISSEPITMLDGELLPRCIAKKVEYPVRLTQRTTVPELHKAMYDLAMRTVEEYVGATEPAIFIRS